jgi:Family of unknown function (DUF6519)
MKGDFSRNTFDPQRHFSRVLMQQGRVQLDTDWNEQASINMHYLRTLTVDLAGPHWGPVGHFKVGPIVAAGDVFTVAPGHYYVNGILCENPHALAYSKQAGFPFPESEPNPIGTFLAYLDVWERHITWLDEGSIREVALGGPDTTTRAQITWQVKLTPSANVRDRAGADNLITQLRARNKMPTLRVRAKRDTTQTNLCVIPPESRYRGAENQLYRVEIHQVVRNADGNFSDATFKWSRDNGSIVFPVTSVQRAGGDVVVTVAHLGRDDISTLAENDMVELVDDAYALRNLADPIGRVKKIDRTELLVTIEVSDPTPLLARVRHIALRRWDYEGEPTASAGALPVIEANAPGGTNRWLALEDGIEIQFGDGGDYRTGDYWLIPARTATGDVEWPVELGTDGTPKRDADGNTTSLPAEPAGIAHHYAPLAIITITAAAGMTVVADCRNEINKLTSAP